jgi:hypothetical protein
MDELFSPAARERTQEIIDREAHVHDVSRRMAESRTAGSQGKPDAGWLANALKTAVQWQFTPSVALMGFWQRVMTGVTKQRAAAMADIALTQGQQGIGCVRDELARREAIRAGHGARLRGYAVGGSAAGAAYSSGHE